jgi:hypothetical protein
MIKIYTFASNRPDFIGLQLESFRKNLKEEFDYTVFNNARYDITGGSDPNLINRAGKDAGIRVIEVEKDAALLADCAAIEPGGPVLNPHGQYANANVAHAYALRWAWNNYISKETDPIAILDSDVFLIQPVKLTDALDPYVMANISDGKPRPNEPDRPILYMWPTFMLADLARLPDKESLNWWCGRIENVPVDVGGHTYYYFQAHPDISIQNVRRVNAYYLDTSSCPMQPPNYDEFYLNDAIILHYRSGSDWDHKGKEYHRLKTEWLKKRIAEGK